MKRNAKGDYRRPTSSARVRFLFIYEVMTLYTPTLIGLGASTPLRDDGREGVA